MTIDMDKICKGCITYERYIEDPVNRNKCEAYIKNHVDCPCQCCLIKAICDDVCEEYKEKWEIFYNEYHG